MSQGMHFRTPGEAEQWAKQMEPHWKATHKKYGGTYTAPTVKKNQYGMYELGDSNPSSGGSYGYNPGGGSQAGGRYPDAAPPVHSPGYAAWMANWRQQGSGNQGGFSAYSPGSAQPRQDPYAYSTSYQGSAGQGQASAQGRQRYPNGGPGRRDPATSPRRPQTSSGAAVDWVKQENERRNSQYRASREEQKRLGQPLIADGGPQNLYRGDDGQVYETHPMLHGLPGWQDNATLYQEPSRPQATRPTPSQEAGQPPDTPGSQIAPTPPGTGGGVSGQDAGTTTPPPRPPQQTGFQTSWGGSPQPFFGGQFGGFQQPSFGGGQFGGFQQPFFGGQFGGYQQPSFGGGQFSMSLMQGLYPGFR